MKNVSKEELIEKLSEKWSETKGTFIVKVKIQGFIRELETSAVKLLLSELLVNGKEVILISIEKVNTVNRGLSLSFPHIKSKKHDLDILEFSES